jgi:membrane protease YdiL (CAAX protease family)
VLALAGVYNGLLEEWLWRGVLTFAVKKLGATATTAAITTSVSFGVAHFRGGYPAGPVGIALTPAFGLVNSFLVERTRSLVIAASVHAGLDALILAHIYG